jgi:hypothetical protein
MRLTSPTALERSDQTERQASGCLIGQPLKRCQPVTDRSALLTRTVGNLLPVNLKASWTPHALSKH